MKIKLFITILLIVFSNLIFSQKDIYGKIIAEKTKETLPFSNVLLTNAKGDTTFGTSSEINGDFSLKKVPQGTYKLEISVIGYKRKTIENIIVANENLKLGKISLVSSVQKLNEFKVVAEKSYIETKPGKKIINVGKDLVNSGGSAIEILSMAPSVEIGVAGGVSIRGESDVFVLINGRETSLSYLGASQALKQIPAASIKKIEIITNAGVEYGPDGEGGMINIILKKEVEEGLKVNIGGNVGIQPLSTSGSVGIEYKKNKLGLSLTYSLEKAKTNSMSQSIRNYKDTSNRSQNLFIQSKNEDDAVYQFLMGGLTYQISDSAKLEATLFYQRGKADNFSFQKNKFTQANLPIFESNSKSNSSEIESFTGLGLMFNKQFKNEKKMEMSVNLSKGIADNKSNISLSNNVLISSSSFSNIESRLGYNMPLTNFLDLKTGVEFEVLNFKVNQSNNNASIPNLKNYTIKQKKHAFFMITEWDLGFVELALGGRAELFDSKGEEGGIEGESIAQNYLNVYPNAQLSTKFGSNTLRQTLMFSYSKRINRPEYEMLSSNIVYEDPLNISQGNPNLKPEFAHIFELGHEIHLEKLSIFTTLFYRITNNVVQNKKRLLANNVLLSTYSNEDNRTNTGVELYLKYDLTHWWNLSNDFAVYNKRFTGQASTTGFTNAINWSNKIINNFKIRDGLKLQLQGKYVGKRTSLFHSSDPYYTVNIGASIDVIKGKGKITLGVRDVFNSIKLVSTNTQTRFTEKIVTKYTTRMINLGFNLNF